jgi:hypothetical protein
MNAPGDSLEFSEGPGFVRMERQVPGLSEAVRELYAERPHSLKAVSDVLRRGEIRFQGQDFEFLAYRRGPTKVYLLFVSRIVDGHGIPKADLEHFIRLHQR